MLLYWSYRNLKGLTFIICGLLIIYFLPNISSIINIPLYLFEPMRIIVVVSIIHSSKKGAYLLGLLLPLFSLILSNHPSVPKTFILIADLLLNVVLYFKLTKVYGNKFLCMSVSILLSKIMYYLIKYLFIKLSLIEGSFIATPIYIQVIIIMVLSTYVYLIAELSHSKKLSGNNN